MHVYMPAGEDVKKGLLRQIDESAHELARIYAKVRLSARVFVWIYACDLFPFFLPSFLPSLRASC